MSESWLPIPGFPGYEVSDMGQVRSFKRSTTPRILAPAPHSKYGYLRVNLYDNGISYRFLVHQLVMLAFVGPCPQGKEICHGKGGASDNRLSNLRYDTHRANMEEAGQSGTLARKLTHEQVIEIRELRAGGHGQQDLARRFNVKQSTISSITLGKSRRDLPGKTIGPHEVERKRASQIRAAYATGRYTMAQLAKEYKMGVPTISLIINNKRCIETRKEQSL